MQPYFMTFHIRGEIAGTLLLREPKTRLLVDISPTPATGAPAPGYNYPNRVCFTLTCPDRIKRFRSELNPGDLIEATGTFSQSGYVPHKTTSIDTTFLMLDFARADLPATELSHMGRQYPLSQITWMH